MIPLQTREQPASFWIPCSKTAVLAPVAVSHCWPQLQELSEWRQRLNTQVKTYQSEMGELRDSLTSEVNDLRSDFETLRSSLRQQIDATTTLAQGEIRRDANSADQVRPPGDQAVVWWRPSHEQSSMPLSIKA